MTVELETDNGMNNLSPDCLMIGIDEAGHEDHVDPHFPVFGLGGCAILAKNYMSSIGDPWNDLKRTHFPGKSQLHAADLHGLSSDQIDALNCFFTGTFFRFAAVTTLQTDLPISVSNINLVVKYALDFVATYGSNVKVDSVAIIIEDSQRLGGQIKRAIDGYRFEQSHRDTVIVLPTQKFFASKTIAEPLVEVADFVIHTAGGEVNARLGHGYKFGTRNDFQVIFRQVEQSLVGYRDILGGELEHE